MVPCGQTEGETEMTKLTVALRNFANASKNWSNVCIAKETKVNKCECEMKQNIAKYDTGKFQAFVVLMMQI